MPQERHFKSTDGLELYYQEYGSRRSSGPTLVCLPGLTRNGLDYEDLALYLEDKGFRVICPDYRGRGNSGYDKNWRNYNMHTYIADLQNLLFRAQVYRFAVIGGSLGGMLAMTMGATLRAMVTGVILNDVGPDLDASGYSKLLAYLGNETGHPDEAAAVAHLKDVQAHLNIQDDAGWSRYAHHLYRKDEAGRFNLNWDKGLLKALERGSGSSDLWSLFRKLKSLPVLLLRGEISKILSEETAARMAQEHPGLQQIVVPGVGHLPVLNEPGLPEAIEEFSVANARPRNPFLAGFQRTHKS